MLSHFDLLLITAAILIMILGFVKRTSIWQQGRREESVRGQKGNRLISLLRYILFHRKILEDRYKGVAHFFIFWGFVIPFIIIILSQFEPVFAPWVARSVSLLLDLFGLFAIIATVFLLYKHFKNKNLYQNKSSLHLWILLAIFMTGFLSEGMRLNIIESNISFSMLFSPVGFFFSYLVPASPILQKLLIRTHFFLVLFFIVILPFTMMRHVFTATLNVYFQKQEPKGKIKAIPLKGNYFGAGYANDLIWKQRLDADACVSCARCDVNCPAYLSEQPLSPQGILQGISKQMEASFRMKPSKNTNPNKLLDKNGKFYGEDIWACTTCLNCVQHCPVFIDHLDKVINMRRHAVLTESQFPQTYKTLFKKLEIFGDCLGHGSLLREDWTQSYPVNKIYQNKNIEVLFWVGCITSLYDERNRRLAVTAAKILDKAGIKFGILGKQELCCGDPARRLGNEYLFQKLAKENIERLNSFNIKKIVTLCPHCFNVFRNEYPQLGGDFEVLHFIELIREAIADGRLTFKSKPQGLFTYHDPCYLGRYNASYQEPREIINRLLDSNMTEMARSKDISFCCGAGGGNFWRGKVVGRRIEEVRAEEAVATNAAGLITACPFCEVMFTSALQQKGLEHSFKVLDIVELVDLAT